MPYIKKEARRNFDSLDQVWPKTMGELTYCVYQLMLGYMFERGACFQTHGEILGALEAAKLEWYRRKVAPYEDTKIKENGDVV